MIAHQLVLILDIGNINSHIDPWYYYNNPTAVLPRCITSYTNSHINPWYYYNNPAAVLPRYITSYPYSHIDPMVLL